MIVVLHYFLTLIVCYVGCSHLGLGLVGLAGLAFNLLFAGFGVTLGIILALRLGLGLVRVVWCMIVPGSFGFL